MSNTGSVHSTYQSTNSPNPSLVDYGTPFDTPGVSGGVQVSNEKNIFDFSLCKTKIVHKKYRICSRNFMLIYLIPIVQIKFLKRLNCSNQSTKIIIEYPPCRSLSCIFKFKTPCESLKEVFAFLFFSSYLCTHTQSLASRNVNFVLWS